MVSVIGSSRNASASGMLAGQVAEHRVVAGGQAGRDEVFDRHPVDGGGRHLPLPIPFHGHIKAVERVVSSLMMIAETSE